MSTNQQLFEITKRKLNIRFDKELAEMLGITKSALSQKQRRGDYPFQQIRQLLKNKGIDESWLNAYENEMNNTENLDSGVQLLQEKERLIQIQQNYIDDLKKTIERMEEEDKKKWIPAKAPEYINQPSHQAQLGA